MRTPLLYFWLMSGYAIKTSIPDGFPCRTLRRLAFIALAFSVLLSGAAVGQGETTDTSSPPADAPDVLEPPADAETFPSGIRSQVVTAGTGENYPSDMHLISVDFIGWSTSGMKLYSSYDIGKPMITTLQSTYPPWREALERMVKGEKRRIWLPLEMVAASRGPRGAAIFELELRGLKSIPTPPDNLVKPPEGAERTPSGAHTIRLEEGVGNKKPGPASTVLVHYMGWTQDGRSFDSSYTRGRPTGFKLDQIMPAFAEAVQMMVAREKRLVWIPGPVAAGNWTGSPRGPLVFEIEMVRILPEDALQQAQSTRMPQ